MLSTIEFKTVTVDPYGQPIEQQLHSTRCFTESLTSAQLELVEIPAGTFLMGAPKSEAGWHPTQAPQRQVTIAPFWMSRYPITQAQWQVVAQLPTIRHSLNPQPACFVGENRPVEQVSWEEAVEFCDRLSAHCQRPYRLPSEAEWEYACRAGTTTPFHFGETITTDLANYSGVDWEYEGRICSKGSYGLAPTGADRRETTEVGSFGVANAFGVSNLHGQVREWCADCWHPTYGGAPSDGSAWISDGDCNQRILRGGSWNNSPTACRSACRNKGKVTDRLYDIGFRVVCTLN